jgi:hypothetical protein
MPSIPQLAQHQSATQSQGTPFNLTLEGKTYQFKGSSSTIEDLARAVRTQKLKRRN